VMTEAEINLAISKIEYEKLVIGLVGDEVEILTDPNDDIKFVDYCKGWSDIGPIIEREGMDLSYDSFEWSAYGILTDGTCTSADAKTPTKAAALCYLKMKGIE